MVLRIGSDSDGVIDTFGDGVLDAMKARGIEHLWKSGPTKKPIWNFFEEWKNPDGSAWSFEQFKELVDWGVDNGYIFSGHWRPHAVASMRRIKSMGHKLIIITDRSWGSDPMNSQRNTIKAFAQAGIRYDELYFTADKTSVPIDMMAEDKWDNFVACTKAGIDTWLITRPWNESYGPHPKRISCVCEYADAVEEATKNGFLDLAIV